MTISSEYPGDDRFTLLDSQNGTEFPTQNIICEPTNSHIIRKCLQNRDRSEEKIPAPQGTRPGQRKERDRENETVNVFLYHGTRQNGRQHDTALLQLLRAKN